MNLKTVGQLKKALENIDDDFEVKVLQTELFRGHLTNYKKHKLLLEDVGYSEKVVILSVGDEIY